jgi:Protein of unknown function (DUF3592)
MSAGKRGDVNLPESTDTTRSDTLWVLGFALALLALAGWMAWESYPAFASRFWPTTQGVVRSVKLWEKRQLSSGKLNSYALDVTYEYTVNGTQYAGWRLNSRSNHFPEEALNTVRQYQPGAACTVHYSPLFPSQSVLDTGVTWHSWVKLALGVAALAGAAWCLLLALRKPTEAPSPAKTTGEGPGQRDKGTS